VVALVLGPEHLVPDIECTDGAGGGPRSHSGGHPANRADRDRRTIPGGAGRNRLGPGTSRDSDRHLVQGATDCPACHLAM